MRSRTMAAYSDVLYLLMSIVLISDVLMFIRGSEDTPTSFTMQEREQVNERERERESERERERDAWYHGGMDARKILKKARYNYLVADFKGAFERGVHVVKVGVDAAEEVI